MENSKKEINQMVDSVTAGPLCAFMKIRIYSEHMTQSLGSRELTFNNCWSPLWLDTFV